MEYRRLECEIAAEEEMQEASGRATFICKGSWGLRFNCVWATISLQYSRKEQLESLIILICDPTKHSLIGPLQTIVL